MDTLLKDSIPLFTFLMGVGLTILVGMDRGEPEVPEGPQMLHITVHQGQCWEVVE